MKLFGSCVLILLLFASPASADNPATLTVWAMGAEGKLIRAFADTFQNANPGVKVVTQAIPWSGAHEKIMTSVIGEIPPDVCQMGTTWMAEFATIGALEPLDDYLSGASDVSVNQFFPSALNTNRVNGQLFGLPWYVDTRILFYRTDLLKEAGFSRPPETWDELLEVARALKKLRPGREQFGIAMAPQDWGEYIPFYWQNGGRILNDDMTAADIDHDAFVESMNYFKSFFDEELAPLTKGGAGLDLIYAFKEGYFPMFIGGPWMIAEVNNKAPGIAGQWAVAPRPGKKNRNSFIGGCNLVTFRQSRNKEWALKFMSYMSRPDVQVEWYRVTTDLPAVRQSWDDDILKKNPHLRAFGEQLAWTQAPPNHPSWEQMAGNVINRVQERIVRGKISVEEGYVEMAQGINRVVQRGGERQSTAFKLMVCGGIVLFLLIALIAFFSMGKREPAGAWSPTKPAQAIPFLFPALSLLAIFLFIPIAASLVMSVTDWNIYSLSRLSDLSIVGVTNYVRLLFEDTVFHQSVFNTFIFVLVAVPLTIGVALGMALVVNSSYLKFKAFFRTGFFIPVITTMVAVAVIWRWLYNPQFGLINLGLEKLSLTPQNWLGDERLALASLILMAVWKNFGYNMIIFIAGLQAIPLVLYEAADIDGVSAWQRFRHITIPMLRPSMIFVCITTVIGYFQFFAEPYIMTEGGPNNATNSIVLYTYNHAFKFYNMGYAAAISYILFMLTLVFSLSQIWYARKADA